MPRLPEADPQFDRLIDGGRTIKTAPSRPFWLAAWLSGDPCWPPRRAFSGRTALTQSAQHLIDTGVKTGTSGEGLQYVREVGGRSWRPEIKRGASRIQPQSLNQAE
jgi:hypothetical protein